MSSVFYRVSQDPVISISTVAFFVPVFCPVMDTLPAPPVLQEFITKGLPMFISLEFACLHEQNHDFVSVHKNNYRVIEGGRIFRINL